MAVKRRVQVTGRSSFIISIPKTWAQRVGLSRGSYVYIEEMPDGSLRVTVDKPADKSLGIIKVIDSRNSRVEDAVRELISAYLAGYESIIILYSDEDPTFRSRIDEICGDKLSGLLLVQDKPGMLVYTVGTDVRAVELTRLLQLMIKNIIDFTETLVYSIKAADREKLEDLAKRDNVVDKIYFMITKILSKTLNGELSLSDVNLKTYAEIIHLYHAAKTLERLSDHLSSASITISRLLSAGKTLSEGTIRLLEDVSRIEKDMLIAFLKQDVSHVKKITREAEYLRQLLEKHLAEESDIDKHSIVLDFHRVISYIIDIAEIVIDIGSVRELAQLKTKYSTRKGIEISDL